MTSVTALKLKLLDWLSSFLDEDDRETVLGDMAEEDASYRASVVAVCGLVLRKEVEKWRSASPWLVLILLLLPFVLLLVVVLRALTDVSAIYLWMLVNNADSDLLRQPGYWSNVRACTPYLLWSALALVGWSWCTGFVIGSACKKVRRSNLILMVLLFGLVLPGWLPISVHGSVPLQARSFIGNAAVFRNVFYRDVFPWLILLLLVVVPVAHGMNDVQRAGRAVGKEKILIMAAPCLILLSLVAEAFLPGSFPLLYCGVAGVVLHFVLRDQRQVPTPLQTSLVQERETR